MELYFPTILDGATGTELQKCGFSGGGCAEAWVLEHPDAMLDIQRRYVAAGSRIIYTPTFGANRVKLEAAGIFNRVHEYNLRLAAIAREAAGDTALVAGDIAPTGLFLAPLGTASFEELVDIYTEQAAALEEAGVDLFVIETMMTLPEARAALLAVRSVSKKPAIVSFTCDGHGRTLTGTDAAAALTVMQGMGADAFGLNCSVGPRDILAQIERLRPWAEIPLLAKPNAGLPHVVDGRTEYDCPPDEFAACTREFAAAGVAFFGGCCGTDEHHIAALKSALEGVETAVSAPEYGGRIPCATEKEAFLLDPAAEIPQPFECDGALLENIEDAQDEGAELIAVRVDTLADAEVLADCQYAVTRPLAVVSGDAAALEAALRAYQGRAIYSGPLADSELLPLAEKYGLII